jgi:hypothetical protein
MVPEGEIEFTKAFSKLVSEPSLIGLGLDLTELVMATAIHYSFLFTLY